MAESKRSIKLTEDPLRSYDSLTLNPRQIRAITASLGHFSPLHKLQYCFKIIGKLLPAHQIQGAQSASGSSKE